MSAPPEPETTTTSEPPSIPQPLVAGSTSANPPATAPAPTASNDLQYDATDESQSDDADSAYAGSVLQSETSTLDSSILKYRVENGRTYHAYGSTEHWGPNDEQAQDQQDLSHHFWTLVLDGELYSALIKAPQDVLDAGTGTGIWAIDVADMIPGATVRGIDLSPIQPAWIPPNVKFEVDDYNKEWIDTNRYDLIHTREILGTVPDWVAFYKKALNALRPGGWIDSTEPNIHLQSIHHPLEQDHPFVMWPTLFNEIGQKTGITFDVAPNMKRWMEEAGFVNVVEKIVRVAVGKWPRERKQKELGVWNQLRLDLGLRDFTERRMRNVLNWETDEILVLVAKCRAAVGNSKEGLYIDLYHVYGQKPEPEKA